MKIEILEIGRTQLLTFLKIADKHEKQVVVIPHKDSIDFKFMDPSESCVAHLKFTDKTHCLIQELEDALDGQKFELNIRDMMKVLSRLKNQKAIMATEVEGSTMIAINFNVRNKDTDVLDKEIQIPYYTAEQKVDFTEINYKSDTANISLPLPDFVDAITEAVDYSTEVMYLIIDKQENGTIHFVLNAVNKDNLRKKIQIIKKQDTDFKLIKSNNPESMKVAYNIGLLNSLVTEAKEYSEVILTFAAESPLTITYHNEADFNLKCMLGNKKIEE